MDVALQLLDSLGEGVPRLALFEARQHVRGGRETRRDQMLRKLHKVSVKKLDRRLDELIAAAAGQDVSAWRRSLATQLTRRAARLRDAAAEAGAIYVPERLHGVRLAAKKLRYALEIAAEGGMRDAAKLAAVVRRTQVTLGHLQDRHVLVREIHEAASNAADDAVRHGLLTIAAQLEQGARELHAEFLAQRDALGAALAAVRQQVVPELTRTARPRRQLRAGLKTRTGRGRIGLKAGA
jgi:CHAD domain-containing protein